jgi:hypothetical protein
MTFRIDADPVEVKTGAVGRGRLVGGNGNGAVMRAHVACLTIFRAVGTRRDFGKLAPLRPWTRLLVPLLGLAAVAAPGGCAATPPPGPMLISHGQGAARARGPQKKITREELTQRLMAFADRYLSRISEATDQLKRDATDPAVRRAAHATKFFPGSAMLTFAAEPDPVAGMLDMLTVATLERMVWQDTGWAVEVFGAKGAEVLGKAQVDSENDIWSCAAAVLPPDRLREVRQVIVDWQHAHPDNKYVSTMRFDNFAADGGELGRRAAVAARSASGGFLAPINEATRAVDETRLWGERFMFITGRMQRMMSWQAEQFVYELSTTDEVKQILANHKLMAEGVMKFGAGVEAWPAALARERAALLKGLDEQTGAAAEVVKNARAAMVEAQPVAADVRLTGESAVRVAEELRGLIRDLRPLAEDVARLTGKPPPAAAPPPATAPAPVVAVAAPAGTAPAGVVQASAVPTGAAPGGAAVPAASRVEVTPVKSAGDGPPPPPAAAAKGFDISEYENLVREMNTLVNSTDSLIANRAWEARLKEVNSAAETRVTHASREGRELINYGFVRGVFFALFCAVLLFATALLYRITVRRLFPQSQRPPG